MKKIALLVFTSACALTLAGCAHDYYGAGDWGRHARHRDRDHDHHHGHHDRDRGDRSDHDRGGHRDRDRH